MKSYLVRLAQIHETFRRPELEALAVLHNLKIEFVEYDKLSPFCIVRLQDENAARTLIKRSILSISIHELWGQGTNIEGLHSHVKHHTVDRWPLYKTCSFKFAFDPYQHTRSSKEQRDIVESFSYLPFEGPIRLSGAEEEFTVFEYFERKGTAPLELYLGRFISKGGRDLIHTYTLKKRKYISTTSMDSELALIGANLALAAPDKLFYDPFVGTGGLVIACSHFGAQSLGSDMDGRCIRGKEGVNIKSSFAQYGLSPLWLDGFASDVTFSPLRKIKGGWLHGIVCDPPYGVREGLRVLGSKDGGKKEVLYIDGVPAHLAEGYVPPRRPYSFEALLNDILNLAADMLVEHGRVSMWMPTANDEDQQLEIPRHDALELVSECIQPFNKWSRRLLTYQRKPGVEVIQLPNLSRKTGEGKTADELNNFRKRFFQGFKSASELAATSSASTKPSE